MRLRAPAGCRPAAALLAALACLAAPAARAENGSRPTPLTWKKLDTLGESGLTFESACSYDRSVKKLVMFGGHGWNYGGVERDDTWLFDPGSGIWYAADPANRPVGACNTRDLVFDASMGGSVYFGGCMYYHGWQYKAGKIRGGAPPWLYDAAADTWIPMKPTGDTPVRTAAAGMAYDRDDQVIVKYGGGGCNAYADQGTWVYDGYANTWTRMNPHESPGVGRLPAMTYDAKHHLVLLFGADDGRSNTLWAYDIKKDSWSRLDAADKPPAGQMFDKNWGGPVDLGILIYDEGIRMPLLFRPRHGVLGTWAYDFEGKTWRPLSTRNAPPGAGLVQAAYVPKTGTSIFVNGGTPGVGSFLDGTWAFAGPSGPNRAPRTPPSEVRLVSGTNKAELSWRPGSAGDDASYRVYRGAGDRPWTIAYTKIADTKKTSFTDKDVPEKGILFYYVTAVRQDGVESAPSMKVRSSPRAPREPWASVLSGTEIELDWKANPEPDVVGYNVYRGTGAPAHIEKYPVDGHAEGFKRLNASPVRRTQYVDKVAAADNLAYLIRAVNKRGEESGPSPWTLSIPSEVQGVRAEALRSGGARVSWTASREQGLRGYNVYRMDVPGHEQGRAAKLNAEPIEATAYVDASKKDDAPCRYYVAAVDRRGVEGIMSYGAWLFDDGRN